MKRLPRVLVNDDEIELVRLVQEALSDVGISSLGSHTCETALKLIETEKPDLLITDIRFQGMSGTELIQKLVEIENFIPVIAISGHETMEGVEFPFFAKPFSPSMLARFIHERHEMICDDQFLSKMASRYQIPCGELGKVVVFFAERGWGLVRVKGREKPIYVNARDIVRNQQFAQLVEGQLIRFELTDSNRGPRAEKVQVVERT